MNREVNLDFYNVVIEFYKFYVTVCSVKCPKCGVEMKSGYLQTGNLVAFNKQRHKISLNSKDPDDVMVARKAFTSNDFTGYICKQCGLIVFDYLNLKTRF